MGYLLLFLLISTGSVFGSLFGKKYEDSVIVTISSIILVLYLFYIFDMLHIGLLFILKICMFLYVLSLFSFIKSRRKKEIINNIFTPGLIVFILTLLIIYFVTINDKVLLWDELRLWGIYPKILYYFESIQLGRNALILPIMQSYEPAMPLFEYFVTKVLNLFSDGNILFAYSIVGLSVILPITKKLSFKKWYYIPIMILIVFMIPLALNNSRYDGMSYYNTLFVEPIIGLLFGYTLYLSCTKLTKAYDYIKFILCLCMICLLKDIGIMFAITSAISYCFNNRKKRINKIVLIIPLLAIMLVFSSWKITQKIYQTENMYSEGLNTKEIRRFLTNPTKLQKEILINYKKGFIMPVYNGKYNSINKYANYYTVLGFILINMYIVTKIRKKKKYRNTMIIFMLLTAVYTLGILFLYLFSIHTVASFQRYMSIVYTGGFVYLIMIIANHVHKEKKLYIIASYITIFLVVFTSISFPDVSYLEKSKEISNIYSNNILNSVNSNNTIALVFSDEVHKSFGDSIIHHNIYYDLIDDGFGNIPCLFVNDKTNIKEVYKDYDYLYFIVLEEDDKRIYNKLLKRKINESTLYSVDIINVKKK